MVPNVSAGEYVLYVLYVLYVQFVVGHQISPLLVHSLSTARNARYT